MGVGGFLAHLHSRGGTQVLWPGPGGHVPGRCLGKEPPRTGVPEHEDLEGLPECQAGPLQTPGWGHCTCDLLSAGGGGGEEVALFAP